jgi:sec-independent protein translocase protein TatC
VSTDGLDAEAVDADQMDADRARTSRRRNPDGKMPLRAHLRELRNRLIRSGLAILAGAVVGWFLSERVQAAMLRPIIASGKANGRPTSLNFADPISPFNQRLQVSLIIGVLIAAPIWLYQFWAFITPGLTRKERRYSFGFVGAALPLFLGGAALAWLVLPKALEFLTAFMPEGASGFITANLYYSFVTRIVLSFGIAFVIPVVLVALNVAHLMSGRTMVKNWRIVVFCCFLFSAVATPTPEAASMCLLAFSMCLLFAIAIGICLLLDRRRTAGSGEPDYAKLDDDAASEL